LSVAPAPFAAALNSANGTATASNRVLSERSVIKGLNGVVAGFTTRAIEPVVRPSCSIVRRGSRNSSPAVRSDARPSRAPVRASLPMRWANDRAPGTAHSGDTTWCAACAGADNAVVSSTAGSASRSTMWASNCTMPRPSAMAWCTFITNAARLPGSPSTTHSSHNGRSLSKDRAARRWAWSSTSRSVIRRPGRRAQQ
jgi:hypothetical protein